jgi:hypothetical protein
MRPLPRLLPAAVLTAVAIAAPAAAAAPWSAPVTISSPHTFAGGPVAFADQGPAGAVAWWRWQDGVGNGQTSGASFAPLPTAATAGGFQVTAPDGPNVLDVQGSGDGRLVELSQAQVRAGGPGVGLATYRVSVTNCTTTSVGAPKTLAVGRVVSLAQLAIAHGGRGGVAYVTYEPKTRRRIVHVAVRSATGAFAKPEVISGRGQADQVSIAAGRRGDLVVAFERNKVVYARVKRPGHGWGSLRTLAKAVGPTQWTLRTAMSDGGSATVLLRRRVLRQDSKPGRRALEAIRLAAGAGHFGKLITIEPDDVASVPSALVVVPGGVAVGYTMQPNVVGAESTPRVAVLASKTGTVFDVAPASGGVRDVRVAWSALHGLLATMTQPLPNGDSDGIGLGAILAPGAVDFGPVEAVTPPENVHEVAPGFAADGTPIAIWSARPEGTGPGIPIENIHSLIRAAARTG